MTGNELRLLTEAYNLYKAICKMCAYEATHDASLLESALSDVPSEMPEEPFEPIALLYGEDEFDYDLVKGTVKLENMGLLEAELTSVSPGGYSTEWLALVWDGSCDAYAHIGSGDPFWSEILPKDRHGFSRAVAYGFRSPNLPFVQSYSMLSILAPFPSDLPSRDFWEKVVEVVKHFSQSFTPSIALDSDNHPNG